MYKDPPNSTASVPVTSSSLSPVSMEKAYLFGSGNKVALAPLLNPIAPQIIFTSTVKQRDFAYYPHANIGSRTSKRNNSSKEKNCLSAKEALDAGGMRENPKSFGSAH